MKIFSLLILFLLTNSAFSTAKVEFQRATNELKASGIEEKALGKGLMAPDFMIDGKSIKTFYKDRPLIIKFYRGHWCPYCIKELKDYESRISEIEKVGSLIVLVPDLKKQIKKTKRDHKLSFFIYRDKDNLIAKEFGLAFKVDEKVLELYKGYNIDLEKSQGNKAGELPMPGTFVVNKEGIITYAFIDADYRLRAPIEDVLNALKDSRK